MTQYRIKIGQPDARRERIELTFDTASRTRDTGRMSTSWRLIDHENDRYRKIVRDKETGETVHEQDHPLTEHTGRGSAKRRSRSEE